MFLIVGLGNPGEEYEHTRHNAGFDAVDLIAEEVGARYWKTECGALTTKGVYRDHDLVLAKPQSYMNTSGGPVKQLMNAYGVDAEHLIVVHDELDIDPGTVRVKFGGGHAGHNGLRSICDKLGTRDWHRVRVGIGRPPGRMPVVDWVLSKPKKDAADDFAQATDLSLIHISGIFLEALLIGLFIAAVAVYVILLKRDASAGARKAVAVLAAVIGIVFSFASGYSYMMEARTTWNTITLPLGYLGFGAASGLSLYLLLVACKKESAEAVKLAGLETVIGGVLALVSGLAFGFASGAATGDAAAIFWVALVCGGLAPLVCGWLARSKPASAVTMAVSYTHLSCRAFTPPLRACCWRSLSRRGRALSRELHLVVGRQGSSGARRVPARDARHRAGRLHQDRSGSQPGDAPGCAAGDSSRAQAVSVGVLRHPALVRFDQCRCQLHGYGHRLHAYGSGAVRCHACLLYTSRCV